MRTAEFKKALQELKPGEQTYINSINLSIKQIAILREFIKSQVLTPDISEVEKMIVPDSIEKVMTGDMICPQMNYTKILPR